MTRETEDHSYWNATAGDGPAFPTLAGDMEVDVAIIGGGIVGVTAARFLKDRGQKVALVEARRVGRQVTGRSTAKMSSQHGILYQTLVGKFGEDKARLYAEAQEWGISKISELASEHGIDADIEPKPAFVYTLDEARVEDLEKEVEVAGRLGLPASLTRDTGLPFEVRQAMRWDGQAQFHPTKYVAGLAATLPGDGCHVFENSRAIDYDTDRVVTDGGTIKARHVVMATNLPLGQVGMYYAIAYPMAEPVIAAPIGRVPPGMYKNADHPGHSIRTHKGADGQIWGIVAGSHYKPGHVDDELKYIAEIERWLAEHFEAGPVRYRWINEDYSAMDSAPFVGWSSHLGGGGYLVATGFAAWGISNGTAAANIIADLATGKENKWTSMFDAARIKPVAGAGEFVKENAEVAAHLVSGYLSRKPKSYDELAPGDAAILKIDGENIAAYRDEQGKLHAVSAVCTHMGCILGWNATDRTWDCPCHGSRFELSGEVIHGPATAPLGTKITG
jgi:glycine/D-amino acid oxidase-like deaminating enzyme/nitrite reductase/ring-hydroxylating ferredoxin subunit